MNLGLLKLWSVLVRLAFLMLSVATALLLELRAAPRLRAPGLKALAAKALAAKALRFKALAPVLLKALGYKAIVFKAPVLGLKDKIGTSQESSRG